jgi:hypothetical protein
MKRLTSKYTYYMSCLSFQNRHLFHFVSDEANDAKPKRRTIKIDFQRSAETKQRQSLNSLWENDQWDVISYVETRFSDANYLSRSSKWVLASKMSTIFPSVINGQFFLQFCPFSKPKLKLR